MEERDRKQKIFTRISMVLHLILGMTVFLPWIELDGEKKSLVLFLWQIGIAGEITPEDPMVYVFAFFGLLQLISAVCSILYSVTGFFKLGMDGYRKVVHWIQFIYIVAGAIFFGLVPMLWTYIIPLFSLLDVLFDTYLSQRDQMRKEDRERKERERQEKLERKRRLAFPGHYSRHFYRVLLVNIRYHYKNYILLVLSGMFMTMYLFLVFALEAVFSGSHSQENLLLGSGLQKILIQAVLMGLVLNVILMILSFSYYIKKKMKEESVFLVLGIRSRAQTMILVMEYVGCTLLALVLGLAGGRLVLQVLLALLSREASLSYSGIPWYYYLIVTAIYSGAAILAAVINHEIYDWMRYDSAEMMRPRKGKIPGRLTWLAAPVGILLVLQSVGSFASLVNGEDTADQFYFVLGLYFCIICVAGFVVRRNRKKGKHYYRKVFQKLPFLDRFWKNTNVLALLGAAGFFAMFMFTAPLAGLGAAEPVEELYPYDFVCMAHEEDADFFARLEAEYPVTAHHYPMLRVTTPQGDRPTWVDTMNNQFMLVIWPQGQHVAVSESAFREMKSLLGEETDMPKLSGEEIYVVFQQDASTSAHPLSWYNRAVDPNLRVGQPLSDYSWVEREALYPARKVAGYERSIVTGVFGRGEQENLVVFSDDYFASLCEGETEGPVDLVLLNVEPEARQQVNAELQNFAEKHTEDSQWDSDIRPYYEKEQMIRDTESERYLRTTVWMFSLLMAGVCGIFLVLEKFLLEMEDTVEKYRFLHIMGMRKKERKKILGRELRMFWQIPLLIAGAGTLIFTGILFSLRMYTTGDILAYLKYAVIIWAVYWLCQILLFAWLERTFLAKAEEEGKS